MKPFSKILVPVDFSAHSEHALQVAADLARRYEAHLHLVHVYQPVVYAAPESFVIYTQEQEPLLMKEFANLLEKAKHDALATGAQQVDTELLQGVAHAEIVRAARDGGCDLVVMGTHGRTGVAHALLGSVAEKVVRKAHCPVLTVRLPEEKTARK